MFDKLKFLWSRFKELRDLANAACANFFNMYGNLIWAVFVVVVLLRLGSVSLSLGAIDRELQSAECQYIVQTTVYWTPPSTQQYSISRTYPYNSYELASKVNLEEWKDARQTMSESPELIDSISIMTIEDCRYSVDTSSRDTYTRTDALISKVMEDDTCTSCKTR